MKFLISKRPIEAKVADRAIPTDIFQTDEAVMKKFIRKWTKDPQMTDFDMRTFIDWDYYKERVSGTIMKIVTIPAALQKCLNPVPRIKYPDWLHKRIKAEDAKYKQKDMKHFFQAATKQESTARALRDIEEISAINKLTLATANPALAQR